MITKILATTNQQPKFWRMITKILATTNQQPKFWSMTKILANDNV